MALGTFAPGAYTMTYAPPSGVAGYTGSPLSCGLIEGVRRLRRRPEAQTMQADQFGKSDIDAVYQGGNWALSMVFKEWTAAIRAILWPFGGDASTPDWLALGTCGKLLTDLAGQIVLTAVTGTPAASNGPATLTFPKAIISPDTDQEIIMGNEPRDIPVVFKLFPYDAGGGVIKWGTQTP